MPLGSYRSGNYLKSMKQHSNYQSVSDRGAWYCGIADWTLSSEYWHPRFFQYRYDETNIWIFDPKIYT